ncbi:MAG: nucleoside triphosphate pyrophosphohydrolase [Bacteroidetes bacterium]|nr:nucleoside triphosphate pyrophosphohydrolase [Bacteroidota bacterium]
MKEKLKAFERLLTIIDELREKCPWDMKQTMESLRYLTIEETYELGDAILENNMEEVKKEVGDLLMHMVFYARIGSETNDFDMTDVLNSISDKLVSRHPHIYGDVKAETAEEVKQNWEQLKLKEGKKSILEGVPLSAPSLVKAMRVQEKVQQVGFDWDDSEKVWDKMNEELGEFKTELKNGDDPEKLEEEFGDILFSLVNYARFFNVNPDNALERTNKKFVKRFKIIEEKAKDKGRNLKDMSLEEMEELWQEAKGA